VCPFPPFPIRISRRLPPGDSLFPTAVTGDLGFGEVRCFCFLLLVNLRYLLPTICLDLFANTNMPGHYGYPAPVWPCPATAAPPSPSPSASAARAAAPTPAPRSAACPAGAGARAASAPAPSRRLLPRATALTTRHRHRCLGEEAEWRCFPMWRCSDLLVHCPLDRPALPCLPPRRIGASLASTSLKARDLLSHAARPQDSSLVPCPRLCDLCPGVSVSAPCSCDSQ